MNKVIGSEVSKSRPKIRFESEAAREQKEQELEEAAMALRQDLELRFTAMNKSVVDQQGSVHKVFKVNADDFARYLRKLGKIADEADAYAWSFSPPVITANFQYLEVDGHVRLAKARLPGLSISHVDMLGEVDFTEAEFLGFFAAFQVVFARDAYFNHAKFSSGLSLCRSAFKGHAYFSNAEILGATSFQETDFKGDGYFIDTSFIYLADFRNTIFREKARFRRASFQRSNEFDEARFNDIADFEGAELSQTSFKKANFAAIATFQDARFLGKADFSGSVFLGVTNYEDASFAGQTRFLDCKFKNLTIFSRAKFELCPRFHEALLHQDTSFGGAQFGSMALTARLRHQLRTMRYTAKKLLARVVGNKPSGSVDGQRINWDAEARAYRTLKLHMSKLQSQHEAAQFFAGEMRSRRRVLGMQHPVHYFISWLYDLLSEFGQSAGRVLLWFALINGVFTYGYYASAQEDASALHPRFTLVRSTNEDVVGSAWDETRPWLALSLQSLNPVAFLSPKSTWVRVHDGNVYLAAAGQSLLNLALIVLLGISLRGQFRRGAGGGD